MLSNLTELIRRIGLPDASVEITRRLVSAASFGKCSFRKYYVFSQPLDALPEAPQRPGSSLVVRAALQGDPLVEQFPRPPCEISQRFASGSECMAAEQGGRLAGFIWLHQGAFVERAAGLQFRTLPPEETVWDYDVYIAPQFRAGRAFHRLWSESMARLRRRGVRFSASFVLAHNEHSIRSHQRLGAFPVAAGYQLRIGRTILTLADRAPRVTLVTAGSAVPLFELDVRPGAVRQFARFRSQPPASHKAKGKSGGFTERQA